MFYFQLVIMAGTVLLAYYFEYTDTFPVHIQGFFCYDKTFSKPYPGPDETSKIPPLLVYSLVTGIPCFTILVGELVAFFLKAEGTQEKTIVTADCCYFNPLLRRIVRFLGVFSFGLFTTTIFANAGQAVTGNQTPHFLSACRPNYTALGCTSNMQYITQPRACTGNPLVVASARKSFPSKDAALSVYSAVYTVMYVTLVFRTKGTRLTKPTVSLTLLCLAMLVGVVKVAEYRNHWADVLAGFFTGGAIAVFLVTCVINNFQQTRPPPPPPRPQRPESVLGMPMVALPCVESPLENILHSPPPALPTIPTFTSHSDQLLICFSCSSLVFLFFITLSTPSFSLCLFHSLSLSFFLSLFSSVPPSLFFTPLSPLQTPRGSPFTEIT
ncbi:phospholipid phosphatase-related protein type 2a isoform X2 [Salmo trutta]|uniref:phospholipid phosphatase-related protein type 2a isoform X2 n=1 Tax=Salmo trutta TaxID=8032 RepID=UPI001130E250|nr:phospholipid phosphatase-related protein type 5-like isoform X2 [Salmo trutta]